MWRPTLSLVCVTKLRYSHGNDGAHQTKRRVRLERPSAPDGSVVQRTAASTNNFVFVQRNVETMQTSDQTIVEELARVLKPHPAGLRRWSVMRAIRNDRERMSLDVSPKFEDEIERVFRRHCSGYGDSKAQSPAAKNTLFHRPAERAGEVWAVYPEKISEWLAGEI